MQVLAGRNNELAKKVAAEANPPPGRAVAGALACDLDALQKLSVAESTLVSWVQEQVPSGLPTAWLSAGGAIHLHVVAQAQEYEPMSVLLRGRVWLRQTRIH